MLDIIPSRFDLVDFGDVSDISGSRSVFHSIEGLADVVLDRRDAGNHGGDGVSADRVLEHTSEFRVSVWDMTTSFAWLGH